MKVLRLFKGLAVSAAVLAICCASAFSQDAGQVLRVSVGFGTLKNTVSGSLTAEKKAQVDALEAKARTANAEGKYGDALRHLYHAMALMRGNQWTPTAALASALTARPDRVVLEPGQSVAIRIGQMFALDESIPGKLNGTIQLATSDKSQQVKASKSIGSLDADFYKQPFSAEMTIPAVENGNYRLSVRFESGNAEPIIKSTTVHVERGLAAQVTAAKARVVRTEAMLKAAHKGALLAALPSAQYRIGLMDVANSGEISFERIDFAAEIREANSLLDALDAGKDPFAPRRGDFKKAYRSNVDNTLQPYRIFVPASYDASKQFPVIIALHGMGGDENSYFDAYAKGAFKTEAERRGYIVACPKGRKPASMYVGDAERDVMDVLAEVKRDYNIDPNRIYLTGHSMGGFGTWSVAMDHPDIFAALAPVAGGAMNPQAIAKIAHVPQLVVHGDNDKTVPVERSRVMVAEGKKLGVEMKYIEVPGGSHIDVVVPTFKDVFDWFDGHRRTPAEAKAAGAKSR